MSERAKLNDVPTSSMSPAMASFVAGTFGGIAGVITGHPFDTIKVRLQSQSQLSPKYSGTFNCFTTIVKEEKVKGLFKGMTSPMLGVAAVNALLFGVYGAILDWQTSSNVADSNTQSSSIHPSLWQIFIAGSGSGFVNSFISTPMELVKIRLQNQGSNFEHGLKTQSAGAKKDISSKLGPMGCMKDIYKYRGISGLFRGLPVTMVRETPSYGAYFASYEFLCRYLAEEGSDHREISGWRLIVAGGIGGIVGWSVTYPFDVVKTIIQDDPNLTSHSKLSTGSKVFKDLVFKPGADTSVLFRGFFATILRAFPTNVAILGTWHFTMMYFRKYGLIA